MSYNNTQVDLDLPDTGFLIFHYLDQRLYSIFVLLLTILTIITNLLLMIAILINPKLRKSPKHLLVLNLCLVGLIWGVNGAIVSKLYIRNECAYSYWVLVTVETISFVVVSITVLLVAAICLIFVLERLHRLSSRHNALYIRAIILTAVCWVVSSVVLIPLGVEGLKVYGSGCELFWKVNYYTAINVLSFLPQAVIVLIVDGLVIYAHVIESHSGSLDSVHNSFPFHIILASFIVVLFNIPWTVFILGFRRCYGSSCHSAYIAYSITSQISSSVYVALPFIWLFCSETRKAVRQLLRCKCSEERSRGELCASEDYVDGSDIND